MPRPLLWRYAPVVLLLFLAPLVAEFLLADFTIRDLWLLLALMPLYGCGALLVREVTRRTGRGWPTIVLLALAYALIEESFLTQSLFNPDYVGQRLLDYGYLPALGTSLNWAFFVLSIHVVWSIATPTLVAEGLAGARRAEPWLRWPGLAVTTVFFGLGCASTASYSLQSSPFVASRAQFAAAAALTAAAAVLAFVAPRPGHAAGSLHAPVPWTVGPAMTVLACSYLAVEPAARAYGLPAAASVAGRLGCEAAAAVLLWTWARRPGWGPQHYLAVGAATTVTYGLFGLTALLRGRTNLGMPTGPIDVAGQVAMLAGVLAIIAWSWRRPA
jgi:hypothetical protein